MRYTIGLDLGIASVGWAVIGLNDQNESTHIVDANVFIVDSLEDDKGNLATAKRRETRGTRRTVRRRVHRINRTKGLIYRELGIKVDDDLYLNLKVNPYEVKDKGLKEKLSNEELAIALVHYVKHRGFKSNRKNVTSKEDGVLLEAIKDINVILKDKNMHPSEYLFSRLMNGENTRNKGTYELIFSRDAILQEIQALLSTQVNHHVITEEFKVQFLDIFSSQRDFSDGPANSKYSVDFGKMFGECKFRKGENRISTACPSFEVFVFLQKLHNLSYKEQLSDEYKSLTKDEINKLYQAILTKSFKLTYASMEKILGKTMFFKDLDFTKKGFTKLIVDYKKKYNISQEERIDFYSTDFIEFKNKEVKKQTFLEMKSYKKIVSSLKKVLDKKDVSSLSIQELDDIATGLSYYKTDNKIKAYFQLADGVNYHSKFTFSNEFIEAFLNVDVSGGSGSLALSLVQELNEQMLLGFNYKDSMINLGYDHSKIDRNIVKKQYLPNIETVLDTYPHELTNPRVARVLATTFKIINEIIKKYGTPHNINIEMSRDIANKKSKRIEIQRDMLSNFERNDRLKLELVNDGFFKHIYLISRNDLIKYRLYKEQGGRCSYSGKIIEKDKLFTKLYEVDHIIPYSRCFNDSYSNKTLCHSSENQEKGNRLPYEWLKDNKDKWNSFVRRISNNTYVSKSKEKFYLAKEISQEMKERSLNDTRVINKYVTKVLNDFLLINGKVNGYNAQVANILKKSWGISNFTHSLDNKDYRALDKYFISSSTLEIKKDSLSIKLVPKLNEVVVGKELDFKITIKDKSKDKEELKRNEIIESIVKNYQGEFTDIFNMDTINNHQIYDAITYVAENKLIKKDLLHKLLYVLAEMQRFLTKEIIKKNRDNHLHHVLDAVTVGCINNSLLQRVTKYHQKLERDKSKNALTDPVTGEVIEFDDDYLNKFPLPYPAFRKEVKYRIYELDPNKQKQLFDKEFNDGLYRSIRPVFPARKIADRRYKSLHKETIYGNDSEMNTLLKRISVKDLNAKKVEKIYNRNAGAKNTYIAVKEWLASKEKKEYPTLPNGRVIKKVTIEDGDSKKAVEFKPGKFAMTDEVVCIDIYKYKNTDKYYFLQRNNYNLDQEKRFHKENKDEYNPILPIWWGQGTNHEYLKLTDINEKYDRIIRLYPSTLIELDITSGKSLCYVVGFTSGMLEVRSIVGDNMDLISKKIAGKYKDQNKITISTIKNITIKKVDVLGYIK